jgi:hypothetical protein
LTALEIEINELGDKIFFRRNGSQVTQVIIQYVYFAGTTVIFAALMFFFFSFFDVDDFVTGTAFPPFFTLGRPAHLSFVLSFLVHRYFCVLIETILGSTFHITVVADDRVFRFKTVVPFTDDTRGLAYVPFSVIVVFKTSGAKVHGAEEPRDARDSVKMVVVY